MPLWMPLLCLGFAADPAIDRQAVKQLQGTWQVVRQEHGGKKSDPKELVRLTMELNGSKMTVRDGVDVREESVLIRLDSRRNPTMLDLKIAAGPDLDKVVKGIWKLEKKELFLCIAEPGKDRPGSFSAREGTGHTLFVFRRIR